LTPEIEVRGELVPDPELGVPQVVQRVSVANTSNLDFSDVEVRLYSATGVEVVDERALGDIAPGEVLTFTRPRVPLGPLIVTVFTAAGSRWRNETPPGRTELARSAPGRLQ
jgi:hypothetical protein